MTASATSIRPDQQWLRSFADVVREFDQQHAWTEVNCIEVTRFGMEVLARLGIRAEPLSVQAIFLDQASIEARRSGLPRACWPENAAWVAVENTGWVESPLMWDGHVALALAPQDAIDLPGRVILDLSADQFARPEFGLEISGPVIAPLAAGWSHDRPVSVAVGEHLLEYRPSDRTDYVDFPAWARRPDDLHAGAETMLAERGLT